MTNKNILQTGEYKVMGVERVEICNQMKALMHGLLDRSEAQLGKNLIGIICGDGDMDHPISIEQNPSYPDTINVTESLSGNESLIKRTAIKLNNEGEAVGCEVSLSERQMNGDTPLEIYNVNNSDGGTNLSFRERLNGKMTAALPTRFKEWRDKAVLAAGFDIHKATCSVTMFGGKDDARALLSNGREIKMEL